MSSIRHLAAVVREALSTAWSQPVASAVTVLMVAGMCASVLLTAGRTVGAEQAVLDTIDSAGTRLIMVRAEPGAGLSESVLTRLSDVQGIEWTAAFGPAMDVHNASIPGGTKTPLRLAWGEDLQELVSTQPGNPVEAWASEAALVQLGMVDGLGGVVDAWGNDFTLAGPIEVPEHLASLEPLVLAPQERGTGTAPVSILVVVATAPELVTPLSRVIQSLLAVEDMSKVSVSTSESLVAIRAVVAGELGSHGRGLVVAIFTLTATLVASLLYGLVKLRRKDFGRRRALGASRRLVRLLLLTQIATLATFGAALGCAGAAIALTMSQDPLPSVSYFGAIALLSVGVGVVAASVPAWVAARQDPLKELRVP
nr:FtsX-like permease family protein [Salinibacterium sp.]